MEATEMSINRWMNKEDMIHTYNGILFCHKKEGNNVICSNMDGHRNYYTKWSKLDKDKHSVLSFICGVFKNKIKMKLFSEYKQTHMLLKQTYYQKGQVEGCGGRDQLGFGIGM